MPYRVLTDEEMQGLTLGPQVANEMGVLPGERFVVKNLASSPAKARAYLRALGYEVMSHGSGFNFAVRKPGDPTWRVVDPSGAKDWLIDLTMDLTSDILGGAANEAGRVGGLAAGLALTGANPIGGFAGAVAGAGAASGAFEWVRELLGEAAGIPDNISGHDIAAAALWGALTPPVMAGVGAGAKKLTSTLGKMGIELAAGIARIKVLPRFQTAGQILSGRAAQWQKPWLTGETAAAAGAGLPPLKMASEAVDLMSQSIGHAVDGKMVEQEAAEIIIEQAHGVGITVDLSGLSKFMKKVTPASALKKDVQGVADLEEEVLFVISRNAAADGVPLKLVNGEKIPDMTKIPARTAESIRRALDRMSGWDVADPRPTVTRAVARQARHEVADSVAGTLERAGFSRNIGGPSNATYGDLMGAIAKKLETANGLMRFVGATKPIHGDVLKPHAETFVELLFSARGKTAYRKIVQDYDDLFGTDFIGMAKEAAIASRFQLEHGMPGITPQLTPLGQILGPSILMGTSGALTGHSTLGLAGAGSLVAYGVAASVATQRGVVRSIALGQSAGRVARKAVSKVTGSPAVRFLGPRKVAEVGGRGISAQPLRAAGMGAFLQYLHSQTAPAEDVVQP